MKVLFHVDERPCWAMALGNVGNMLQYGEETGTAFTVEVLANGPAVLDLQPGAAEAAGLLRQLEALAPRVRICACRNALRANGVSPQSLLPFVEVVPAGVVELAARQAEGYAYIKP